MASASIKYAAVAARDGRARGPRIVGDHKPFSPVDAGEGIPTDGSRTGLDGALPPVECIAGPIGQVFKIGGDSSFGVGTTFRIGLPVRRSEAAEASR